MCRIRSSLVPLGNTILVGLLLVSCSITKVLQPGYITTRDVTAFPTRSPGQTTDGNLILFISTSDDRCHPVNEPFLVQMVFVNLSEQVLTLQSRFAISPRQYVPEGDITIMPRAADGSRVFTRIDFTTADTFFEDPTDFIQISPHSSYSHLLEYSFPREVAYSNTEDTEFTATKPGTYFIRIMYINSLGWSGSWAGSIDSNKIQLCIAG